jgi:molecular chaperone HtpG
LKGIVDSEDIPLNISREMLQQSRVIRVIRKNIIKRSIELFQELSEDEDKYNKFYENFSKNIKLGIHEDSTNRDKLAKLLRYESSKNDTMSSLDAYISNMPENQKDIYYITGESVNVVKQSSFVEGVVNKGYDVLFMTDPIDEYVLQQLKEYDGKKLVSITKSELQLPESTEEKQTFDELTVEFKDTCERIQAILGTSCEKVVLSNRLTDMPCCIVTGQYGWSANMERIMKAQTMGDNSSMQYMVSKKVLEINPNHNVIKGLKRTFDLDDDSSKNTNKSMVNLMFETALIESGFTLGNVNTFALRIYNMLEVGLGSAMEDVTDLAEVEADVEADVDVDVDVDEAMESVD